MQEDLEPVPLEVFALRVRRFFAVDVECALAPPWQSLDWHVDNRCSFCEYLGENRGQHEHHACAGPAEEQTTPGHD